jgi:peptide/nickel transport system permease protein
MVLMTLLADHILPYPPLAIDVSVRLQPPSWHHLGGTDNYGRDLLSRAILASRVSAQVAITSVTIGFLFGVPIGIWAAIDNRIVDLVLMRFMDILYAFPAILLAIAVMAGLGNSLTNAMLAIGIIFVAPVARLARATTLNVLKNQYIEAARALGMTTMRIVRSEVFPNIVPPLLVQATQMLAFAVLLEAALSFLGIGTQPPQPSWGNMLDDARGLLAQAPWMPLAPGLGLFMAVLGLNLIGDGLRDFLDPRLRV